MPGSRPWDPIPTPPQLLCLGMKCLWRGFRPRELSKEMGDTPFPLSLMNPLPSAKGPKAHSNIPEAENRAAHPHPHRPEAGSAYPLSPRSPHPSPAGPYSCLRQHLQPSWAPTQEENRGQHQDETTDRPHSHSPPKATPGAPANGLQSPPPAWAAQTQPCSPAMGAGAGQDQAGSSP